MEHFALKEIIIFRRNFIITCVLLSRLNFVWLLTDRKKIIFFFFWQLATLAPDSSGKTALLTLLSVVGMSLGRRAYFKTKI